MTGFEILDWAIALDKALFLTINGWHTPFWDPIMVFASNKYSWYPLYAGILAYFGWKFHWKGLILALALILSVVVADQFASGLLKPLVKRWRPCYDPELQSKVYLPINHCGGDYGFISSHAATHFAVASFLFFIFKNKYKWIGIFFLWSGWIAYSRIYLGVHFPGDVIAGSLAGFCFGWLAYMAVKKWSKVELN